MPRDRFEVDLTSVCVRRGAVQLPFRLKDVFSEGPVTAVDADGGSALELSFRSPRELAGLAPFFEAHALRANDSVALLFTDEGLQLQAIRRERGGTRFQRGASDVAGSGGRPAPPANASPGGAPGASESSSHTAGGDSAPRSAASPTPPSLRMEVPKTSEPAEPGDPPERENTPRWRSLDVTAGEADPESKLDGGSEAPASDPGLGRVVVREVRRSRQQPPASEDPAPAPYGASQWPNRASEGWTAPRRDPDRDSPREQGDSGWRGLARRFGRGRGGSRGARRQVEDRDTLVEEARRSVVEAGDTPPSGGPGAGAAGPRDGSRGDDAGRDRFAERPPAAEAGMPASDQGGPTRSSSVPDVDSHAEVQLATATSEAAWEPEALRGDVASLQRFLVAPGVPAIVRTERVADALGMSVTRAERALERLSEEWDHLSRIRAGAYMLRRPSEG